MRRIPFDIGTVHFTGIGGIGMSGIAEAMHTLGYSVQGSDISENANVERLKVLGIPVVIGQTAQNIDGVGAVVTSTAIRPDNPEVVAASEARIPLVRRADMLAELMRLKWCVSVAGTHGKTTTTSMVAAVLDAGGFDPTVINGGIINAYGTNARMGEGDWMVVEADESDGSFMRLPATIAIVTNIDPEHLDFYGDYDAVKAAFRAFADRVPFYGAQILCTDHPAVRELAEAMGGHQVITYGLNDDADVRATNIRFEGGGATFDVEISERLDDWPRAVSDIHLPMPGEHNVQNAVAAITAGLKMGMSVETLKTAFQAFSGVKRRFTKTGEADGVTIIDDYGHHPVEIAAVLKAAKQAYAGRIIAVVQPHRYTRLNSLFDDFCACFTDADDVLIAPVYEAGEDPIPGADHESLAKGIVAAGHGGRVYALSGPDALAERIAPLVDAGDVVVCLGAGSITAWAYALPDQLAAQQIQRGTGT